MFNFTKIGYQLLFTCHILARKVMLKKNIFLLIVVINTSLSYSQEKYTLNFYNCNYDDFAFTPLSEFNIYDTKTGKEINYKKGWVSGKFNFSTDRPLVRIKYKNIYNQAFDTIINLNNKNTSHVLCIEKFKDYSLQTTFEQCIKNKKKWELNLNSTGCFHWDNESFKIKYKKNKVYVVYKINRGKKQYILLNQKKIDTFILFEKKLRLMNRPNGGCTTSDLYTLNSFYGNLEINDDSCTFNDIYSLKEVLGIKNGKD
ncbi:conserved hypothetical protein [Tenacibaculum sp. 190524A05c]|uniref:DKNYY family protein n=2 Tax=Tenacibaculum platacis TaxID=3137852 RepID=A0ABM9NWU6_9FLAO